MASQTQYLLVSLPQSVNAFSYLERSLNQGKQQLASFKLPEFQIKTLDSLVQLSEELSKLDNTMGSSVAKVVDTFDNLEPKKLHDTRVVNGRPASYTVENFSWNTSKYRVDKPIKTLVDLISSDALSLDNDVRLMYQQYLTAKSNFLAVDRRKNRDLSIKSLHDIVRPEHFVLDSEHLTTLLVAVPKNLVSDFEKSYETITQFVVPRSAQEIAADSEYVLFSVSLFKKFQTEFVTACREHKWNPRTDFVYSEEILNELRRELDTTRSIESKSKVDLMRLAKTAYSEIFSGWIHIKVIRIYVESVLRYGLPPQFDCYAIKFEGSNIGNVGKAKKELIAKFGYLGGDGFSDKNNLHEYASLVDSEFEPFVLYHLEIV
ncbi:ATPase, V1 complex, subunit C [Metschnikowia bicuspidata]|uniref:V-type proton ATPase subunit C n=1 Tax=Metschnikowia bicuspidata TaxID=27322 RepID=A0A4P9ZID3_9ASCO|nr:ATPase, V1 complex, subunit C [Metschnikowia bicuspidata]